ncbi:MAG: tyrosine--tRNA ligase, partial [Candidatus Paceibacterota bacterium]
TDQTFNMLAGRSLQQTYNSKEKFIITLSLLADPATGKKMMSKSEGDYVSLAATPEDMYGGVMALPDGVIIQMFEGCTFVPMEEVSKISAQLGSGEVNPRDIKMRLAREIVRMYHGEEQAGRAEASFVGAFQQGGVPSDMPTISVSPGAPLVDVLLEHGIVESKSAFRRLVESGAVKNLDTEEKIEDPAVTMSEGAALKIGKKTFVKIEVGA